MVTLILRNVNLRIYRGIFFHQPDIMTSVKQLNNQLTAKAKIWMPACMMQTHHMHTVPNSEDLDCANVESHVGHQRLCSQSVVPLRRPPTTTSHAFEDRVSTFIRPLAGSKGHGTRVVPHRAYCASAARNVSTLLPNHPRIGVVP